MKSIFLSKIYHKRFSPTVNEFTYSGFYIKFSLDNIQDLKSPFFGINRFNLFSFHEKDHGYRDGSPLEKWGNDMLAKAGIKDFQGKYILQTFPRMLGYVFNPVSFWHCYDNYELVAVICEVNNTFNESHTYVLKNSLKHKVNTLPKRFHVSPFYDVKGSYSFDFTQEDVAIINYYLGNELQLTTSLSGKEIRWSNKNFLKIFVKKPFFTFFVMILIHWQALKLFIKKNQFYPKPQKIIEELTYEHHE